MSQQHNNQRVANNSESGPGAQVTEQPATKFDVLSRPQSANPQQQQGNAPRMQLFNSSGATLSVPILNKTTGEKDIVFVQHGGRPKLAAGFTVDPVFASRNPALQASKVTN